MCSILDSLLKMSTTDLQYEVLYVSNDCANKYMLGLIVFFVSIILLWVEFILDLSHNHDGITVFLFIVQVLP